MEGEGGEGRREGEIGTRAGTKTESPGKDDRKGREGVFLENVLDTIPCAKQESFVATRAVAMQSTTERTSAA